tara:strand:+ start:809 stop:958 length:150 start_codon:yes stop_codon:yes gene_type:complete
VEQVELVVVELVVQILQEQLVQSTQAVAVVEQVMVPHQLQLQEQVVQES